MSYLARELHIQLRNGASLDDVLDFARRASQPTGGAHADLNNSHIPRIGVPDELGGRLVHSAGPKFSGAQHG